MPNVMALVPPPFHFVSLSSRVSAEPLVALCRVFSEALSEVVESGLTLYYAQCFPMALDMYQPELHLSTSSVIKIESTEYIYRL